MRLVDSFCALRPFSALMIQANFPFCVISGTWWDGSGPLELHKRGTVRIIHYEVEKEFEENIQKAHVQFGWFGHDGKNHWLTLIALPFIKAYNDSGGIVFFYSYRTHD